MIKVFAGNHIHVSFMRELISKTAKNAINPIIISGKMINLKTFLNTDSFNSALQVIAEAEERKEEDFFQKLKRNGRFKGWALSPGPSPWPKVSIHAHGLNSF